MCLCVLFLHLLWFCILCLLLTLHCFYLFLALCHSSPCVVTCSLPCITIILGLFFTLCCCLFLALHYYYFRIVPHLPLLLLTSIATVRLGCYCLLFAWVVVRFDCYCLLLVLIATTHCSPWLFLLTLVVIA